MKYSAIIFSFFLFSGCTTVEETKVGSKGLDEPCRRVSDCESGLNCVENPQLATNPMAAAKICTPIVSMMTPSQGGQICVMNSECEDEFCCGNGGICRRNLEGFGTSCGSSECRFCGLSFDCAPGLVCSGFGQCLRPDPGAGARDACEKNEDCTRCGYLCLSKECRPFGTAEIDEACGETAECKKPLICHPVLMGCQRPPFFAGTSCKISESERGLFRPYFVVPRQSGDEEFYQMPFPTDFRRKMGQPDMTGHYAPDPDLLGFDLGGLYFSAIEKDLDGFGLSQPVFFRYTDPIDRATITSTAAKPSVMMVNIDAGSGKYGNIVPTRQVWSNEKGQFMCAHALGVAPIDGYALEPNTTYAVILTTAITSRWGAKPIRDRDFLDMLRDQKPNDPVLDLAHAIYAPLRSYLEDKNMDAREIAVATVYTTGNPSALAVKLREAVRNSDLPTIEEIVVCGSGDEISCNATDDPIFNRRGCSGSSAFTEFHAKIKHPVLQKGNRPYQLSPAGSMELDGNGVPIVQSYEELCISIAIPKDQAMPAGGWPVVIYGHGTGGNFTSVTRSATVSNRLARNGIAVIGFDGMLHGPRQSSTSTRTSDWKDPGLVFFNAINPRASQFNVMQGSADVFNLVRFAEMTTLTAAQTGAAADMSFNPDQIMYYGHSQGTVIAPPVIAHESKLKAVVLTGAGGEIGLTVVHKRKPNDLTGTVRAVLGDQSITRLHPMIGILSWYFGATDAIAFGRLFAKDRTSPARPVNLLHIYGLEDGFTPNVTQKALIRAGGYPIFGNVIDAIDNYTPSFNAVQGNVEVNGIKATVGALQYANPVPNSDGHFTGTENPEAVIAIQRFLRSAIDEPNGAVIQR